MNQITDFTNLYSLSKTLRFELKPIGKTLEHIEKNGLLTEDQHRAESYAKVKKIIDRYHKAYIEKALSRFALPFGDEQRLDSLTEYYFWYVQKNNDKRGDKLKKIQDNLRKLIAKQLTKSEEYKRIDKKELIKEDLLVFLAQEKEEKGESYVNYDEEKALVEEFSDFTTYFTGFHENRQNMYSEKDQSTAIAYRLIHENLPKFIDNSHSFEKVKNIPEFSDKFAQLYKDFESYLKKSTINVNSIAEMFELGYYSKVLTQSQIDTYNAIIGGRSEEQGQAKIQGLNEYINLYNQQNKDARLPKLKPLFKQILSDREAISWLPEAFEKSADVLGAINECYLALNEQVFADDKLPQLLKNIGNYDLSKIYITNDLQLTDISQKAFGNWSVVSNAIEAVIKKVNKQTKKEDSEKYDDRIRKILNKIDSFSIADINHCIYEPDVEEPKRIEKHFTGLLEAKDVKNIFARIADAYDAASVLLNTEYPDDKNLAQDKENVEKIKNLLDAIKELQHFIKPLCGKGTEAEKDSSFYGEFNAYWDSLNEITQLYNKVRNFVTQKPYSEEKIKLNFANSTLLNGWDFNKESTNTCVLLRKDGLYYLAIMDKKHNKVFTPTAIKHDGECYEKMVYKLLPGANKMLPKVFFSKSRIHEFNPSDRLLSNYEKGTHTKGDNFNINHCHELIDFFKASINKHEDWRQFGFQFSDTARYDDLSGFYREVEHQGYKVTFSPVSVAYVNQLVEEGKIYLFQIYNKDFSPFSKGTPNMHTIYWKMLFNEQNLADVVYKLNGQAEVFYRKKSIFYDKERLEKGHHYEQLKGKFAYPIIKDRRYAFDKFQFHVPITMNFKATGTELINNEVNNFLRKSTATHIIGIDRGERHLLYLTLIDLKGNIVKQMTLNEIVNEHNGKTYTTNYHDLLNQKEKSRDAERKSWNSIETIKELKEGYLSQVIHKIAEMMVQYNAIVVLEDLNFGFMRGRQKVEKQVYQKFEKMLIDKLNYLVDKKKGTTEAGGALHALQLTNKFVSFQSMGKQSGFLFYVPAWNTSKMDPSTGFVNLFDTRYTSVSSAKDFFGKFDAIRFNAQKGWFEFEFDYNNKFTNKAEGSRTKWTLCTYGERIDTFRNPENNNQWDSVEVNLTAKFKELFSNGGIDINGDLKAQIAAKDSKDFFEGLLKCLKLTLQMRNSITGTDVDYLISPVMNQSGEFFDSRKCGDTMPQNADANGAYNIARKGLWIVEQIKNATDLSKVQLAISNKEWLQFAQSMSCKQK